MMRQTILTSIILGAVTVLGFTVLAQAKYEDYYLQCTELKACNLIGTSAGKSFVLNQYSTEPVTSCTGVSLNHSEVLERNCVVRLSIKN